jgi:hypothetical protein
MVLATLWHGGLTCACHYEARIVSLLLLAVKIVLQLTKTHHFDDNTLHFNFLDSADVIVVGLCRHRRRGVQATTRPPLPPRRPCPDAPTPSLGAPPQTMRHSWLMRWGSCMTAQGKARLMTSGSYWMSGPGGGSTLHEPMAMWGSCGCSSPTAPQMPHQMGPGTPGLTSLR